MTVALQMGFGGTGAAVGASVGAGVGTALVGAKVVGAIVVLLTTNVHTSLLMAVSGLHVGKRVGLSRNSTQQHRGIR